MAALASDRNTVARSADIREVPVKAGVVIYAGAMVAIDATGFAVPASTSTTLKVIGRAEDRVDNSTGANGDVKVQVGAGVYRYANSSSTDALALIDLGASCYAVDDQTVAKTSATNTRSVAGVVFDVDALGVWVKFS